MCLGATPTRAGNNFLSSTNLGHTQKEIKSSLWNRIFDNEPGIIKDLIKPHLVDSILVTAIERALGENAELEEARDLLFNNLVPETQMYAPMVSAGVGYMESSPEQMAGHTAPSYHYLQCSACTDFHCQHRVNPDRIMQHGWAFHLCPIVHHSQAKGPPK